MAFQFYTLKSRLFFLAFFTALLIQITSCENRAVLTLGEWQGELHLRDSVFMPFNFVIDEIEGDFVLTIVNGAETITLKFDDELSQQNHFVYHFDIFDTYLRFDVTGKDQIAGVFVNESRKDHKEIPFTAQKINGVDQRQNDLKSTLFNGKWQVEFNFDNPGSYPAIGEFLEVNGIMIGTFRTETGDYRFLSGYAKDGKLRLSAFDGSHVFYFEAEYEADSLIGQFYSGSHWETKWYGIRNDTFELASPYELTQLKTDDPIAFTKKDLNNQEYIFPNEQVKNKVVIIQIFGSWCPNCLDETNFYNELYEKYADRGLEIIAIGYEKQSRSKERIERLNRYKERMLINYPVLVGGEASKDAASKDFPMFNAIISFPTSIFLNKKGEVVKIHTGFNGPGTGEVYDHYVERTTTMVEHMLEEH